MSEQDKEEKPTETCEPTCEPMTKCATRFEKAYKLKEQERKRRCEEMKTRKSDK